MRLWRIAAISMAASIFALASPADVTPANALPPNTVPLSEMVRGLSAQPGFVEAFLKQVEGGGRSDAALITPRLIDYLRRLITDQDWDSLDRFPGWPMFEITPTVGVVSRVAADPDSPRSMQSQAEFLDVGPYALDEGGDFVDFRKPSTLPDFASSNVIANLGYGMTYGDGPGPLASEHADSQRLADALNRLAANGLDGVPQGDAIWNDLQSPSTPEGLIQAILHTGQTVTVTDSRFFANFGHLHYKGQDVMMPFFLHAQVRVPKTTRPLLVPVSHAEYEWHIRGPRLNADVSFYFGIDGKAEFRAMDSLDQAWVMKRDAHLYGQVDALEVTRLAGAMLRAYMRLHQAHPDAPFGGYYSFGVCQDVVAAIELKLTGKATLWPNTADAKLFTDPRDAEINALIRRLPNDRDGAAPAMDRVFASLPVGSSDAQLATVTIPGLGADLVAVHDAWINGQLQRTEALRMHRLKLGAAGLAVLAVLGFGVRRLIKRRRKS
jgi:hypothetical protein